MSDYTGLPSWVSISATNGSIMLSNLSVVGTYDIIVFGEMSNYQYTTQAFKLVGTSVNNPPTFSSTVSVPTIQINLITTYTLPLTLDPDGDTVAITAGYELG